MTRGYLGLVALLPVLMTLILFSCIQSSFIPPSYAAQQEEGARTLRIRAYLENIEVEHGNKETIHFQVADHKTHQPIGGAITSATRIWRRVVDRTRPGTAAADPLGQPRPVHEHPGPRGRALHSLGTPPSPGARSAVPGRDALLRATGTGALAV